MSQVESSVSPIRAAINELEGEYTLLEPALLDAAVVGVVAGFGDDEGVVCYDRDSVLDILTADGMSRAEAEGFFDNVLSGGDDSTAPRFITGAKALMAAHSTTSVRAAINDIDGTFMLLEPADMDAALVGLVTASRSAQVTCYDRDQVIDILMRDGMDRDEAEEFFSFNIEGAYMGEATPVYLTSTKALVDQADLMN